MNGERGDVGRSDDAPDRERRAQLVAPGFESVAEKYDADSGVSTKPAAMRLTRTGASSSARAAVNGGSTAVAAEASPRSRLIRRPPVPPMSSSVPPGRILGGGVARDLERQHHVVAERLAHLVGVHLEQGHVVRAAGR